MSTLNPKVIKKLIEVIRLSPDKGVVVRALTKLRTDLVKDSEGIKIFLEADGLKPLMKFLGRPHVPILEVALSLIANCCTVDIGCQEALDNNITTLLCPIILSIPNSTIQCRACRLLGNVAKYNCNEMIKNQAMNYAQAIIKIIENSESSTDSKIMALRANRFLLCSPDYMKNFTTASGFSLLVKSLTEAVQDKNINTQELVSNLEQSPPAKVGLKKSMHREKYFEEVARNLEGFNRNDSFDSDLMKVERKFLSHYVLPKDKQTMDMVLEILRCLLQMSELQITYSVWESLMKDGCTLAPLVFFASKDNNYRCMVLKTLANFSKNLGAFVILSGADAIVAACDLVVAKELTKPLTEHERRYCVTLICMLSTDACHRAKIRRSGTLRTLISLLRDSKHETEKTLILYILNNFQYDNMSLDLMLWDGLVQVLVGELNNYLTLDDEFHKKRREERQMCKKRKMPVPCPEAFVKVGRRSGRPEEPLSDDSPGSSPRLNSSSSSPTSSGNVSPRNYTNRRQALEEDSYSPVCSDADDDEESCSEPKKQVFVNNPPSFDNTICAEILKLLDACHPSSVVDENVADKEYDEEEVSKDAEAPKQVFITRSSLDIVENLLFRLTLLPSKHDALGKVETMLALIDAIEAFGTNNSFAACLANIVVESRFFERIIKSGIPHRIFMLKKLQDARIDLTLVCNNLTKVSESYYGKSELERFLRSGTDEVQKRAAIAIAYTIKQQTLLYQFLNDGNVLSILLSIILSSKTDVYTHEAVDALTEMCRSTLGITLPVLDPTIRSSDYGDYNEKITENFDVERDMTFAVHLEDGKSTTPVYIEFNKQLLCDASEVFSTMMNGSFRESKEGIIHMHNCSPGGLRYFLNLILCQSKNEKFNIPARNRYEIILEAFEMTRIYIMPVIERKLLDLLIWLMNERTCLDVLGWALKNYHYDLTETTIHYYLCSLLDTYEKIQLFRNADYSTISSQWFQLIIDCVLIKCRNGI